MATLIRVDRNGTKYYEGEVPCTRCDGKGIYYTGVCNGRLVPSWVDNGVCFKCGGTGKEHSKWKEYTPEYEAKLEARRRAKAEKIEVLRRAEEEAKKLEEEEKKLLREAEEQRLREQKAKSQYFGTVGDKVDMDVVLEKNAWFEVPSFRGFGTETMHIYTFRNSQGDALIWKTSKGIVYDAGQKVHITGTIKEHSVYDEEKQTVLTRCKIWEV